MPGDMENDGGRPEPKENGDDIQRVQQFECTEIDKNSIME